MSEVQVATFMKVGEDFVSLDEFRGPLLDDEHVEGGLEIFVDGKMISNKTYWDDIDYLWDYIIRGLECLSRNEGFSMHWPDQPIKLSFIPVTNRMTRLERTGSSDPDVSIVVDRDTFFDTMLEAGAEFFRVYSPLSTAWDTSSVLYSIEALKESRDNA